MVTVTNRIYVTDSLLQGLSTKNIPNIDLNHCPMYNQYTNEYNTMYGSFHNNQNVVSITNISNNITNIGSYEGTWETGTFSNCYNLIDAPDLSGCTNLVNIGTFTFANCYNLVNAPVIPNGVMHMGQTFWNCSNLVNVPSIPNSVTNMAQTFRGCFNLVDAPEIPNSVTDMASTFHFCTSLVNAPVIPNSVTYTGDAFQGCYSLVNAPVIPNSVTYMRGMFSDCYNLINAPSIPNSVVNMAYTFSCCYNLVNAPVIPNSVTNMYGTFYGCSNLVNAPEIPESVENTANLFGDCFNLVNTPSSIPNTVFDMSKMFRQCQKITNLPNIPNSVTIMKETFQGCWNLVNAPVLPNSIVDLSDTFHDCLNLVNAPVIPNNVTNMYGTFWYDNNLSGNITINSEIIDNAQYCFDGTSLDKNVYIPFTMTYSYDRIVKYYWITNESSKVVYTKIDFYSQAYGKNQWLECNYIEDEYFNQINGARIYWNGDNFYLEYYDENMGTWITENISYNSSGNVLDQRVSGDNSFTYDAFVNAGYSSSTRVDGVLLMDINDFGTLTFSVTPSQGTQIYVDGTLLSESSISIPSGNHEYKLVNSNYPVYYGSTTVSKGGSTTVTKDLTQIVGHKLTINTNVENCTVTINGKSATTVTSTSYESDNMYSESSMSLSYSVTKEGYTSASGTVTFNNTDISINVELDSTDIDLSDWSYTDMGSGVFVLEDYEGQDVQTLIIPNLRN